MLGHGMAEFLPLPDHWTLIKCHGYAYTGTGEKCSNLGKMVP